MAAILDKYTRDDSASNTFRDSKDGTAQHKEEEDHRSRTEEDIWASDRQTNMEEEGGEGIREATSTGIDTMLVREEDAEDEEEEEDQEDEEDEEEEEKEKEESIDGGEKKS
ncbi:hypothetical protein BGX38DRAFT_1147557 [Terfezia claveryi]|nr:hypothetical protein BGX38DRAFT_1147557 [Terfezia claveryi]